MNGVRISVLIVAVVLMIAGQGQAQILSNLPGTSSGTGTSLGLGIDGVDRTKAVGLTMGPDDMFFMSMVAFISNGTPAATVTGGIYSDVGGNPGVELVAYTPVPLADNAAVAEIPFTVPGSYTLSANTTYWFLLDGPAITNLLLWNSLDPNVAPTPAPGITYVGYRYSSDGGVNWGSSGVYNGVSINADLVPVELQSFEIE